ncbi:MAG: VWA domain-containing protein [bacterium]|nr:VWA domain-containing protein [bacterium]
MSNNSDNSKIVNTNNGTTIQIGKKPTVVSANTTVQTTGRTVDIAFIVDTTGSMNDKIEALISTCVQFLDEPKKLGLEPAFGLVAFGDISGVGVGDTIEVVVPITQDLARMKYGLQHIPRNSGFGNNGESSSEAIVEALSLNYRSKAVKVMVLITDEPALQNLYKVANVINQLTQQEFLVFVLSPNINYFKLMAKQNGGEWQEISPTSNLDMLLEMFKRLAQRISEVSKSVHVLGQGSVSAYLQLTAPKK